MYGNLLDNSPATRDPFATSSAATLCPLCGKNIVWSDRCPECGIQVCQECMTSLEVPLKADALPGEVRTLRVCKRCSVWMEHR